MMFSSHSLRAGLQVAISTAVLAIALRTWLVMGLIEPVVVAGSSMAPTLRGDHVTVRCPLCQHEFEVGAEFAEQRDELLCSVCRTRVSMVGLTKKGGDRLWIDRTAFSMRRPYRWELVVTRCPVDGQLCVKRIVGLPGETVTIKQGDVWVDGRRVVKRLEQQRRLRQAVFCRSELRDWWQPAPESSWKKDQGRWRSTGADSGWLTYMLPEGLPLTDDIAYNASLSRRLSLVSDWMLSCKVSVQGKGELMLRVDGGAQTWDVTIRPSNGQLQLSSDDKVVQVSRILPSTTNRLLTGEVLLELSTFDRRLLLALDGKVVWTYSLQEEETQLGIKQPVALAGRRMDLTLRELTLYRDVYFSKQPVGVKQVETLVSLEANEYYLLGDNPPVSLDSRVWGPVSGTLFMGRPWATP